MNKYAVIVLTGALLANAMSAGAYDPDTHEKMSVRAFSASVLATDSKILDNMGLPPLSTNKKYPNSQFFSQQREIFELFQDGAKFEDGFGRPLNHFFDPLTGKGLAVGSPSPDWAIDGTGDSSTMKFSFKAAREYLWQATAKPLNDYDYRQKQFGLMFETLGHVIHHIQDMAQPQHVRNDLHCDAFPCYLLGIHNPSLYESYTKEGGLALRLPYTNTDYNTSTQVKFGTARQFWTTDTGKGMAEFSNSNFVSAGTNFNSGKYTFPAYDDAYSETRTASELCLELGVNCTPVLQAFPTATLTFYGNDVVDQYKQTVTQNWRASSESIFDADLQTAGRSKVFSLNRFNFDAAHQFLIPRAVSYSAGLINYFFRGKMTISLPDEGVYSVVDHAVTNKITDGFTKIKLKLSNATPNESMGSGTLVAVAKFHRNNCYTANLSGEFFKGNNFAPCPDYRSSVEEIVTSDEIPISGLGTTDQPYTFNFGSPIPINATDLYLQIVFKGKLGDEEGAVVVATKDISEPTYLSFFNTTDWFCANGTWMAGNDPQLPIVLDYNQDGKPDYSYAPAALTITFSFKTTLSSTNTISSLPAGRYSRMAVLTNSGGGSYTERASGGYSFSQGTWTLHAEKNQMNPEQTIYYVSGLNKVRTINVYNSLSYYLTDYKADCGSMSTLPQPDSDITNTDPYPFTLNF